MRPGQQKQRGRGRNNNNGSSNNLSNGNNGNNNHNRKGQNPLTRSYDSSGPDVKIRGTAQHIAEKYMNLARDAQSAGDRVVAENYLQHAEHYNRIIAAAQAQMQERYQRDDRSEFSNRDSDETEEQDGENAGDSDTGEGNRSDYGARNDQGNRNDQQASEQGYRQERPERQQGDRQQNDRQPNDRQPNDRQQGEPRGERQQGEPRGDRNNRNQNNRNERGPRPNRPEREPHVAAPVQAPVRDIPVMDGSGPQPDIEGIPAEVTLGQEDNAVNATATERTPARRRAAPRPRRQPRKVEGEEISSTEAPGAEAAVVEVAEQGSVIG